MRGYLYKQCSTELGISIDTVSFTREMLIAN